MTDKYILVKVRDAERGGYNTNMGKMRKAIHLASDEHDISVADMVTHTRFMTADESRQVTEVFETAMDRGKREHARQIKMMTENIL